MLNEWISQSTDGNLGTGSLRLSFENSMCRTFFWFINLLGIHFYTFEKKTAKEINSFKIHRTCSAMHCLPLPAPPRSETHHRHSAGGRVPSPPTLAPLAWRLGPAGGLRGHSVTGSSPRPYLVGIAWWGETSWYAWEVLDEPEASFSSKSCQPLEKWSPGSPFLQISPS